MHTPVCHQAASVIPEPSEVEVKAILVEGALRCGAKPELVIYSSGRLTVRNDRYRLHPALICPDFHEPNLSQHTRSYNFKSLAVVGTAALPLTGLNHFAGFLLSLNHNPGLFDAVCDGFFNIDVFARVYSIYHHATMPVVGSSNHHGVYIAVV